MNAIEAFLAQRTGYCERLRMRLTPEGCAAIRNRSGIRLGREDDDLIGSPLQCRSCPGLDVTAITAKVCVENAASVEATPLVEEVASAPQVDEEQVSNKPEPAEAPQPERVTMPVTESTLPGSTAQEQLEKYTPKALAALAGVPLYGVYDAKKAHLMGKTPQRGNAWAVLDAMSTHGITWDMVIFSGSGEGQPDTAPVEKQAAPFAVPPFSPWPKAEQTDFAKAKPEYEHYPLSRFTMEEIVGEVVRRVPRAEVVLR